jgi:hypothetical protein
MSVMPAANWRWYDVALLAVLQPRNTADRPISHDYLFHTMLSLTQVRTTLHLPRLSVLEECYAAGASDTGLTPDRGNPAGRKP